MTIIHNDCPYETVESLVLRERINAADDDFRAREREHHVQARRQCAAYDTLLMEQRPSYPTAAHLEALDMVAGFVHDGVAYGDHLGRPTPEDRDQGRALPDCIRFESRTHNLTVLAQAPFSAARPGANRLWAFYREEEASLRDAIGRRGLRIISEWPHDDGLGFNVVSIH